MTVGNIVSGTSAGTHYFKRVWNGVDGLRSEEHQYNCVIRESELLPVRYNRIGSTTVFKSSMDVFCPSLPKSSTPYYNNELNKCSVKAYSKLLNSPFNAGVFSAEFRESYHMICSMVHGLAKGIRLLKKKRYSEAIYVMTASGKRQPLRIVAANHYMVWHFGILPTLSDLKGLCEYLQTGHTVVKRVKVSSKTSMSSSYTLNGVTWNWTLKAYAAIRGEVVVQDISELDRLGFTDPLSVAWEATKFSWLLDWVLPIGNLLAALNAARKTYGNMFYCTTYQDEKLSNPVNGGIYFITPFWLDAYRNYVVWYDRRSYNTLPWKFPVIENPLGDNLNHWVTSAAFLTQVLR